MRRRPRRLPVIYGDKALREIDEVADWNETTYGHAHAIEYILFLRRRINALAEDFVKGR